MTETSSGREALAADVVIVGGGQAGSQLAVSLRGHGYEGSILILEAGPHLPYERPPLTKAYLRGERSADELALREAGFWADSAIDIRVGQRVREVDAEARAVTTDAGLAVSYGTLVWAAGGHARRLPGTEGVRGVVSVRTLDDAEELRRSAAGIRDVVVIGGGFIGLEAAAVLRERGAAVTVLEAQDRLLARVTSPPVSEYFAGLHRAHGSTVLTGVSVQEVLVEGGAATGVRLDDGTVVPADVVLVGIGLVPDVEPLCAAGAACGNGVDVDSAGRTSLPDVYAIGDCANRVTAFSHGQPVRIESVPNAVEAAKLLAERIARRPDRAEAVPWFWSHQFDAKLQTVGLFNAHDDSVVRGDPASGSFSVVYLRDGAVIAIDCVNSTRDFAQGKALVAAGPRVDPARLADPAAALKDLLAEAA